VTQRANDISVVICAYTEDRWNDLVAAVESVRRQTLPAREILVVVDYNPDLLKKVQEQISGVVAVENREARGVSGARNSGIALARGRIIAFLDDDAIAAPDWLLVLTEGFTNPQVTATGGAVTPLWLNKAPAWFPEEFYWVVGCTYRGMPRSATAVRNLVGANMSFRREVFDCLDGFRNDIGRVGTRPIGCEDTELCIRMHQRRPQSIILYQPQACVSQWVPGTRASWRYFCSRCYSEGLSKAAITRYVGLQDGLASERSYTLRTLPEGVVRGLTDALLRRDPTGFARAGAIVVGLAATTAGYVMGSTLSKGAILGGIRLTTLLHHTPRILRVGRVRS